MSRRGDCFANAVMEAFFSTVKTEPGDRFETGDEAKRALFEYVDGFYNSALVPFNGRLRESGCLRATSAIDANERTIRRDDKTIARIDAKKKPLRMLPRNEFSRGAATLVSPLFRAPDPRRHLSRPAT
jgi:hypothetical protein